MACRVAGGLSVRRSENETRYYDLLWSSAGLRENSSRNSFNEYTPSASSRISCPVANMLPSISNHNVP